MRATNSLIRRLLPRWTADVFVEGRAIAVRKQLVEHVALRRDHRAVPLDQIIHSVPRSYKFGVGPVAEDAIDGLTIIVSPSQD